MGIAKAALIIMFGNIVSRLLGLVRDQVIAGLFGASSLVDAFTAAYRLPLIVYDFLIGGMISAALVPVFSDYAREEKEKELWALASVVLSLASLIIALALAAVAFLAPLLMSYFASGYSEDVRGLSVGLVRFMLPAVFFMSLSGILTALHYSRRSFTVPALCIAVFNASIIVSALLFHETIGVYSIVAGMVAGGFLQTAIQMAFLRHMRFTLSLDLTNPGLRRIIRLYIPVALGLIVSVVGIAIDTNLASFTGEGSLAAMRYATAVTQFPIGLVASAVSFAVLPSLSRLSAPADASSGDNTASTADPIAYKRTLAFGLKLILLAILPATIGLVVLREPLIRLLFEHGEFTTADTARTALAFLAYSPGLPAAALDQLLIFAFYARKNTIAPVLVGVMGVFVYLIVGLSLIGPLGMPGLALANSAQLTAHALIMFVLLWRAIGGLRGLGLESTALKAIVASAIMGLGCYAFLPALGSVIDPGSIAGLAVLLSVVGSFGAAVYAGLLVVLRAEEVGMAWDALRLRLGRQAVSK